MIYQGTAGDLSADGHPLTSNVLERDDMRMAIVFYPIYTSWREKNFWIEGKPNPMDADGQRVVFIIEAKGAPLDVTFARIHLGADCKDAIGPRGAGRVYDDDDIGQIIPEHRRNDPEFDRLIWIKETAEYPSHAVIPPKEQPIDETSGLSCFPRQMMLFELVYALPDCYRLMQPMTLTLDGIRVGEEAITPIEIDVVKREYEWTQED